MVGEHAADEDFVPSSPPKPRKTNPTKSQPKKSNAAKPKPKLVDFEQLIDEGPHGRGKAATEIQQVTPHEYAAETGKPLDIEVVDFENGNSALYLRAGGLEDVYLRDSTDPEHDDKRKLFLNAVEAASQACHAKQLKLGMELWSEIFGKFDEEVGDLVIDEMMTGEREESLVQA